MSLVFITSCNQQASTIERLDKISSSQKLVVAADVNTGFPFVHKNKELDAYGGFEYDVAEYLANQLQVKLEIVPTPWDQLLQSFKDNKIDIVLNGIEKPEDGSSQDILYSKPYYISHQQIIVPKKDSFTYNLSDLDKKKVGVIQSSVASAMLDELNRLKGTKISVQNYQMPQPMFEDLNKGDIDALLTERAIASWFGWQKGSLKLVGDKILQHSYVVAIRHLDTKLFKKINTIFEKAPEDEVFKAIEKKWHL